MPSLFGGHGEQPLGPVPDGHVNPGVEEDQHDQGDYPAEHQHHNHSNLEEKETSHTIECFNE